MGVTLSFRCHRCGLEAEVSGGKDVDFFVETQTNHRNNSLFIARTN